MLFLMPRRSHEFSVVLCFSKGQYVLSVQQKAYIRNYLTGRRASDTQLDKDPLRCRLDLSLQKLSSDIHQRNIKSDHDGLFTVQEFVCNSFLHSLERPKCSEGASFLYGC